MTWFIVWSSLLFVLGLILGGRVGLWLGEREGRRQVWAKLRARAEERRAARWLDRVRETRGGTVMPYRPPEVAHEGPGWSVTVREWPARSLGGKIHDIHGGPGQDCWCGYVGAHHAATYERILDVGEATDPRVQAGAATDPQRSTDRSLRVGDPLALAHLTDEEFTARMAGLAAEISAAARLAPDPYDQLWSTQ